MTTRVTGKIDVKGKGTIRINIKQCMLGICSFKPITLFFIKKVYTTAL